VITCLYVSGTMPLPLAATPEPQDNPDQANIALGRSRLQRTALRAAAEPERSTRSSTS